VAGVPVIVVHLSLDPAERQRHLASIRAELTRVGSDRAVVVGDLNEEPGGACWTALNTDLTDAAADAGPTFPAWDPSRRIDAILVGALAAAAEQGIRGHDVTPFLLDYFHTATDGASEATNVEIYLGNVALGGEIAAAW